MSKKKDDLIDNLIEIGIGALAVYFLVKILSKKDQKGGSISRCPHCGYPIKKWAVVCPSCRKRIHNVPIQPYDF